MSKLNVVPNRVADLSDLNEDEIQLFYINLTIISGKNMRQADFMGKCDPYVEVFVNENMRRTKWIAQDYNPVWNANFHFFVDKIPKEMKFNLYDEDERSYCEP